MSGKCRWKYPKPFAPCTEVKDNAYPVYARPDDGSQFVKGGYTFTNKDVAPYNPALLRMLDAHVNVEVVTWVSLVKYLFSYIAKVC